MLYLLLGMGASDDLHSRVQLLGDLRNAAGLEPFWNGDEQVPCLGNAGFTENGSVRRIAANRFDTRLLSEADDVRLVVDQHEIALSFPQPVGDRAADAAIADDDDMRPAVF